MIILGLCRGKNPIQNHLALNSLFMWPGLTWVASVPQDIRNSTQFYRRILGMCAIQFTTSGCQGHFVKGSTASPHWKNHQHPMMFPRLSLNSAMSEMLQFLGKKQFLFSGINEHRCLLPLWRRLGGSQFTGESLMLRGAPGLFTLLKSSKYNSFTLVMKISKADQWSGHVPVACTLHGLIPLQALLCLVRLWWDWASKQLLPLCGRPAPTFSKVLMRRREG